MKKGFTLIELLAVIVILAIILAVAVPGISNLIDNVRLKAFVDNEELMVRAAKKMVGIDESYLPQELGETKEVKLTDLQANKYIGTILSPIDRNIECGGYVLVTKLENNRYDYTPKLDCITAVSSMSEDGLVGFWKFDGDALDHSLNNNHGTIYGATKSTDHLGNQGGALSFDGVNDYIKFNTNSFISQTEGSLAITIKFNSNSSDQVVFISGQEDANFASTTDKLFLGKQGSTQRVTAGWRTTNEPDYVSPPMLFNDNEWHQIICLWSLSLNKVYMYVDGVHYSGDVFTSDNKNLWVNEFIVGKGMSLASVPNYFNGEISDIRIYDRVLSEDEIKSIYNFEFNRN